MAYVNVLNRLLGAMFLVGTLQAAGAGEIVIKIESKASKKRRCLEVKGEANGKAAGLKLESSALEPRERYRMQTDDESVLRYTEYKIQLHVVPTEDATSFATFCVDEDFMEMPKVFVNYKEQGSVNAIYGQFKYYPNNVAVFPK